MNEILKIKFIKLLKLDRSFWQLRHVYIDAETAKLIETEKVEGNCPTFISIKKSLMDLGIAENKITFDGKKSCNVKLSHKDFRIEITKSSYFYLLIENYWRNFSDWDSNAVANLMLKINEIIKEFDDSKTELQFEFDKHQKLKSLNQQVVEALVKKALENCSFEYYLEKQHNKMLLLVKLKYKRQLEISIPYENFKKQMANLISTITTISELLSTNPSNLKITTRGNQNINWLNGQKSEV